MSTPKFRVLPVTPKMAAAWLAKLAPLQRHPSDETIAKYERDMIAGKWILSDQAITFNAADELVNGQHRLRAVVKAGVTCKFLVATGMDLGMGDPLDQGYGRKLSHLLGRSSLWVGTVSAFARLQSGDMRNVKASCASISATYDTDPASLDAVLEVAGKTQSSRSGLRITSPIAAAAAFAYPVDHGAVVAFLEKLASGEGLSARDAALTFRNWLIRREHLGKSSSAIMLATCNAIRYAISKEKLGALYLTPQGYRSICTKRRALKIPHTPSVEIVESATLLVSRPEK